MEAKRRDIIKQLFESGEIETADDLIALEKRFESESSVQNETEAKLIKAASLLRNFNREIYENVLQSYLDDTESQISFEDFVKSPKLEPVPRAFEVFRVKDEIKLINLEKWKKDTSEKNLRLLGQLAAYYSGAEKKLDLLGIEALTDPKQALKTFTEIFDEADQKFDLARCNDAISVLQDRREFLSQELKELLEEKEQYLRARNYFTSEYHKTVFYQTRTSIIDSFEDLLNTTNAPTDKWIYQIFAMGGMGKTMFARWLISRYLVPNKIPVAQIDFDFLDLSTVSKLPWLLIFDIAEQLNFQIKGSPFQEILLSYGTDTSLLRPQSKGDSDDKREEKIELLVNNVSEAVIDSYISRISDSLKEISFDKPFVIILDTLERVIFHPDQQFTQKFFDILTLLQKLATENPQMRLLLSGRYDLSENIPNYESHFQSKTILLELHPFTEVESRKYLLEKRKVKDRSIVDAIINKSITKVKEVNDKTECNPFKLSLLTDFYQQGIAKTAKEISEIKRTDLAYLIERIIKHIPEESVRWLLRYATIPRAFSYDFFEKVLAKHLEAELINNRNYDLADSKMPKGAEIYADRGIWNRDEVDIDKLNLQPIWNNLKNYASGYSWIKFDETDNNLLRFQPDVVVPMRFLLEEQKIFEELHIDAIKYFEDKAGNAESSEIWVKNIIEAIYHHCQIGKTDAEIYWRKQLNSSQAQADSAIYKQIAEAILSQDFVDEKGQAIKKVDEAGKPLKKNNRIEFIVHPQMIYEARARTIEAAIGLIAKLSSKEAKDVWKNVLTHLDHISNFEKSADGKILEYKKPFETESSLDLAKYCAKSSTADDELMSLLKDAIAKTKSPEMHLSLEFLLGDNCSKLLYKTAFKHFENALEIRKKLKHPQLKECRIHLAIGNFYYDLNNLDKAKQTFERNIKIAKDEKDYFILQKTLRDLSNVTLQLGNYDEAFNLLQEVKKLTHQTSEENKFTDAVFASQFYARSFFDPLQALREIEGFTEVRDDFYENAYLTELRGDIAGMLMQFNDSFRQIERAKNYWTDAGNLQSINRCRLLRLSYLLFHIGNFEDAKHNVKSLLAGSPEVTPIDLKLMLGIFDIFLNIKTGNAPIAEKIWQKLSKGKEFAEIPHSHVQVLALGIVFKFARTGIVDKFIAELKKVTPVSARLPLLNTFELAELPFLKITEKQKAEIKDLIDINSTGKDIIPHALFRSALLGFCGDSDLAKSILKKAENYARKHNNPFVLRQIFLAQDRLDTISSVDITKSHFFRDFAQYDELCFAAYVEQAERFSNRKQTKKSKQCLESAEELLNENSKSKTQFEANYYEILGKIAVLEGDSDLSNRNYNLALSIYKNLGQEINVSRLIKLSTKNVNESASNGQVENTGQITKNIKPTQDKKKPLKEKVFTVKLSSRKGEIYSETYLGKDSLQKNELSTNSPIAKLVSGEVYDETNLYEFVRKFADDSPLTKKQLGEIILLDESTKQLLNEPATITRSNTRLNPSIIALLKSKVKDWLDIKFISKAFNLALEKVNSTDDISFDLRLDSLDARLAKIPWELATFEDKTITNSFNNLYRSNSPIPNDLSKNKWIQLVLNDLGNSNLFIDGVFGPKTRSELDKLKKQLKIPADLSDEGVKKKIQEALVSKKTDTKRQVLIIKSGRDAEIHSQRNTGTLLEWSYEENYFTIENLPAEEIEYLPVFLQKVKPDVIHIQSSYRLARHSGEIHLDFFGNDEYQNMNQKSYSKSSSGEKVSTLSPTFFKDALAQFSSNEIQPVIIMDAICPRGITEILHQLMYRNVFANELFQLGNASAVLAMGLSMNQELQNDLYYPLTNSLSNSETFGAIAKELRNSDKSADSLEEQIPTAGIALFTNEPDLTILQS